MIDTIKQSAAAVATSREVHRVPALTIRTVLFFLDRRCCSGTVLIMVLHGARLPMEAGAPYRGRRPKPSSIHKPRTFKETAGPWGALRSPGLFGHAILRRTGLFPPSPPAEKATASDDQAGQSGTRDGTGNAGQRE